MTNDFTEDEIEKESIAPTGSAVSYGADYALDTIAQYVRNDEIIVQPSFQRKHVWDKNKASKLIESFLLGYPVPNVLLGRDQNGNKMEVIDGQQRILAITSYLDGDFKGKEFKLVGDIHPKYSNKAFIELEEAEQRRLRNQVLKATILVYPENENNLKFSVFQRINTGSVVLTQQEIRNCIYGGSFNDLLHSLNVLPEWRELLSAEPDSRMRDEETILRFFTAYFNRANYRPPMTKFLNDFMYKNRNLKTKDRDAWEELFKTTLGIIRQNFSGSNPFSLLESSKQLNRAIFEAIMVAVAELSRNGKSNFSDFTRKHAKLIKDKSFQDSVSTGTSSDKKYNLRLNRAMQYLK